jgi:hypothetical protein
VEKDAQRCPTAFSTEIQEDSMLKPQIFKILTFQDISWKK